MKAEVKRHIRTCHVCEATVTKAVVITQAGSVTICFDCWEAAIKAVRSAIQRDARETVAR